MTVAASIRIALRAISVNALRGILTALGVIIGVAAVVRPSASARVPGRRWPRRCRRWGAI